VKSVDHDSPAAKAGLKESDVVLEYNGQRIEGTEQFVRLVHETPIDRQVKAAGLSQRRVRKRSPLPSATARSSSRSRSGDGGDNGDLTIEIPPMPPMPPMPDMPEVPACSGSRRRCLRSCVDTAFHA
jgi:membrane-associated protease RseP (regulator of RpoE activity)